ncbi:MAG: hypothetical protein OXP09_22885 [Gammaproteobacteria bacterium]|nr:hypothetical protein [Gammaproteobacteria bacterium]MDE0368398.1 hypothetical protein [Gammaproteobacteria bacterium]
MTDGASPTIHDVFEVLNRWRHLPSYPLEGRAAPFFEVFLRDVLSVHFETRIHDTLVPEFPLRVGTLYPDEAGGGPGSTGARKPSRDQSYNVDYVAFGTDNRTAYLVELKTDVESIRTEQQDYLDTARNTAFRSLVEGVGELARASNRKQKYVHLLHRLAADGLELVHMPKALYDKSFPKMRPGWTRAMDALSVGREADLRVEIVFVQPRKHESSDRPGDFHYIYFDDVADIVEKRGDLGQVFAAYLRQWTKQAGFRDPRQLGQ